MEPISTTIAVMGAYEVIKSVAHTIATNAPKIRDGAQRLWRKTQKKSATDSVPGVDAQKVAQGTGAHTSEARTIAAEAAIEDLKTEMLTSSELIKALADQSEQFSRYIDASRLQFEAIEKQNGLLAKRVESDSALIKGLESYNLRLVKDVEVERVRVNRLTFMNLGDAPDDERNLRVEVAG